MRWEEKLKNKEEYKKLKREYYQIPRAVIREASEHYSNKEVLLNFLNGINKQLEDDKKMDVDVPEETKLPSVPYDHDIKKAAPGVDNFRKFRANLDDVKEKLKDLKKEEWDAFKQKDPETIEKCKALRE